MLRQYSFLLILFLTLAYPFSSFAQISSPSTNLEKRLENVQNRLDIRQSRPGGGPDVINNLKQRKENVQNRQDVRQDRQESFMQFKDTLQKTRQEFLEKKTEIMAQFKEQREAFKEKLSTIRDQKKQAIVERLDHTLSQINERRTNSMNTRIDGLLQLLDKIIARADELKNQGVDTSIADGAIAAAQTALESAQSGVSNQSTKDYVITLTSETNLRPDVSSTVTTFKTDMQTVLQTLIDAHHAVKTAAQEVAKLTHPLKNTIPSSPTESPTAQPTTTVIDQIQPTISQ